MNRTLHYFKKIKFNPSVNRNIANNNKKMFAIKKQQNYSKIINRYFTTNNKKPNTNPDRKPDFEPIIVGIIISLTLGQCVKYIEDNIDKNNK
jgi:hypothetical protein